MTELTNVTRIQLQTDLGRYEFWADRWEPNVQDDGRTLHLRGRGEGHYAKTQRDQEAANKSPGDAHAASVEESE